MEAKNTSETTPKVGLNFIEAIIEEDIRNGKNDGKVYTRFPPEPNGYLHIGHAKSICLNFGIAKKYHGKTNLRFDDTNPVKEDVEYVDSIKEDIQWLGFQWHAEYYASDYFEQLYQWAIQLIEEGKAYVDDSTQEEISRQRGVPTAPGIESPYRNRSVSENLDLFQRMRQGEFPDGSRVLRAKIDMASPNMHMRDPIMYRILHAEHHRTGNQWCIYPMYDYAHGQSDSIEGITHSICTLEFEVHRPLYDWFCKALRIHHPQQIEFARLNINYTVMSKRKLLQLVQEKHVRAWDDPRMPTICGLRRRGYTPESIRNFAETIGVAKRDNVIDISLLEFCVREDLNKKALRTMAVLDPLKLIIDNYPEGQSEMLQAVNNPENKDEGVRSLPFSRELWIERSDFMEDAPKDFFRLTVGKEVRLKYAYIIKCESVEKDSEGKITAIHCTYDPQTRSGMPDSSRKVKGTIHWLSAAHCKTAEVRLFDRLFYVPNPDEVEEGKTFLDYLNPDSLQIINAFVEPMFINTNHLAHYQFERIGYFCIDKDSSAEKLVFNKTVSLKDTWTKHNK
ncbi:MAG TPA: glutamine--tRNA ligase/YqeY domain fusion protein [Bacteroidales bacterium]|nr:glutamine--tRNA ligase/YqeY domain fusion protein [Bacteroidales bacterium]HOR82367.1 glutamine--tRNA ligase/YqeY domain fusion protein [Bacteroidales bacterium]HPJ91071.1 glutamine--tRNA ligase/YqeY domain fusion protein [Bacteroidales bacterium]HPX59914.1 glutamine--tRNA ligase/YqeY domain fusion protein [Bacteroidales bacterium]HQB19418.1 glutamine--tRNA ligase/YqeY domain fusion protein [Bacteroidales bacterium]